MRPRSTFRPIQIDPEEIFGMARKGWTHIPPEQFSALEAKIRARIKAGERVNVGKEVSEACDAYQGPTQVPHSRDQSRADFVDRIEHALRERDDLPARARAPMVSAVNLLHGSRQDVYVQTNEAGRKGWQKVENAFWTIDGPDLGYVWVLETAQSYADQIANWLTAGGNDETRPLPFYVHLLREGSRVMRERASTDPQGAPGRAIGGQT